MSEPIQILGQGPINRLHLAMNHYISTGDHYGEGIGFDDGDDLVALISVNQTLPDDQEDFRRFAARFEEICASGAVKAHWFDRTGRAAPPFLVYGIAVDRGDITALGDALVERPGPLGWGSTHPTASILWKQQIAKEPFGTPGPAPTPPPSPPVDMSVYAVGKPYNPNRAQWPETVQYNYRGGQHAMVFFLNYPNVREVEAIQRGACQFAVMVQERLIFLLYRFAFAPDKRTGKVPPGWAFAWSDCTYSWWQVVAEQRQLPNPEPGEEERVLLHIHLVNAATGILLANRLVTLDPTLSTALNGAIREQARQQMTSQEMDAIIRRTYGRFDNPAQMVLLALAQGKGGE